MILFLWIFDITIHSLETIFRRGGEGLLNIIYEFLID